MHLGDILDSLPGMPGADAPHCHSPMTAAEAARQLLAFHPRAHLITMDEARSLVAELGRGVMAGHRPYVIGGEQGGNLGGPGTWISTGKGAPMLGVSGTMPIVHLQNDAPDDETVLPRLEALLRERVAALGADPDIVRLVDRTPSAFGDGDTIGYATPATTSRVDHFHGHYSHNRAPFSPSGETLLDAAARQIVAHHQHADEIARRMTEMADLVRRRFSPMGCRIGETTLITIEAEDGALTRVDAATPVSIIGNTFQPHTVIVRTRNPHVVPKGEFDGLREHARTMRRRLKILAGRKPDDAYTICPVVARSYEGLSGEEAEGKKAEMLAALQGRSADEGSRTTSGMEFIDGHLVDLLKIAPGVTFRNRTLMVQNAVVPQTIMQAVVGRRLRDVVDDPRLDGLTITAAKTDKKGRTVFTVDGLAAVPLAPVRNRLHARAEAIAADGG